MEAPPLPQKFPCWCRAVYSWGGESKKDLGFVEGDLIECLSAGDGQWWVGRLHRDRRARGMFPSNFVKLLDQSFVPVTRGTSPMPDLNQSATPPKASKGTTRKPFKSYSQPAAPIKKPNEGLPKSMIPSPIPTRQDSFLPNLHPPSHSPSRQNSYKSRQQETLSRQHSHLAHSQESISRQNSYISHQDPPSRQNSYAAYPGKQTYAQDPESLSRAPSPFLPPQNLSRVPSPVPPVQQYAEPSDVYFDRPEPSPSPPPPPPHRVPYQPRHTPSPEPGGGTYGDISTAHSPTNTHGHGHTPSPLRDAMEDVMSSLQGMGARDNQPEELPPSLQAPSPSPMSPWSPEAFAELNTGPRSHHKRANTSMGIAYPETFSQQGNWQDEDQGDDYNDQYQHRTVNRLRDAQSQPYDLNGRIRSQTGDMPPPPPPQRLAYNQGQEHTHALPRPSSSESSQYQAFRPGSSMELNSNPPERETSLRQKLRNRKSAYELGRDVLGRTFTTKSTATNGSSGTMSTNTNSTSTSGTNPSLMSGHSAGGFSATSAGSFARRKALGSFRKVRPQSVAGTRDDERIDLNGGRGHSRTQSEFSGPSYHSSHGSGRPLSAVPPEWAGSVVESGNPTGGLAMLKPKKSGFLKKIGESFRTGAASTRSSIAGGGEGVSRNPVKSYLPNGVGGVSSSAATDMGLASTGGRNASNWVNVRRDVNRSNSLSRIERTERIERCEMMGQPIVDAIDILEDTADGDEGIDGLAISNPTEFLSANLQLVDKSARFVVNLPAMINVAGLAQGFLCRPYRSDVQRLRAIFTWVSEKIRWEEDFESETDTRRVVQTLRGSAQEVAVLVMEMCQSVGLHAEVVRGYLKPPDELPALDTMPRPNHWWNAVLADGEWRIMDCSLASPTNPKRSLYSSAPSAQAETFYFLARPMEACYTHVPSNTSQQHIVPSVDSSVLLALPCAMPAYFTNSLHVDDYSTALLYIEGLELLQLNITVPSDTELFAEVKARSFARDMDGDLFESGDTVTKRALAQAEWKDSLKRYIVKGVLPADEGHGVLHIYAGKRGLMHGIKDNPHQLAMTVPIYHTGSNPPFDFFVRHPTPHAQRHDLYLAQPQCRKLVCNNTFVFSVRQHPSSMSPSSPTTGRAPSPNPFARPASSLSMTSSQASGSNPSTTSYMIPGKDGAGQKPAKLAVQAPSGKIIRMSRKIEGGLVEEGGTWEAIIKVGERGTWRGLVLADRSARWCVWGEWECT